MPSIEDSGRTPRPGPRAREEEEAVAPVSTSTSTRDDRVGDPPTSASQVSGCGSLRTDPDDGSLSVTKNELTRTRQSIGKALKSTVHELHALIAEEVRQRDLLEVASRMREPSYTLKDFLDQALPCLLEARVRSRTQSSEPATAAAAAAA